MVQVACGARQLVWPAAGRNLSASLILLGPAHSRVTLCIDGGEECWPELAATGQYGRPDRRHHPSRHLGPAAWQEGTGAGAAGSADVDYVDCLVGGLCSGVPLDQGWVSAGHRDPRLCKKDLAALARDGHRESAESRAWLLINGLVG